MMQNVKFTRTGWLAEGVIAWQPALLSLMVFLALARWLAGGTFFGLESGYKGMVETGLLILAIGLMIKWWGKESLFAGLALPGFLVLALFILWAAVTLLWSPSLLRTGIRLLNLVIIVLLSAGIATHASFSFRTLVWSVLAGLSGFIVFMLVANLFIYGNLFPVIGESRASLNLAYEHYNNAATFYVMGGLLALHCLLNAGNKQEKTLPGVLFFVFIVMLVFSTSRTGLGGMAIASGFYVIWHFKWYRVMKGIQWAILIVGGLIILLFLSGIWQTWMRALYETNPEIFSLNGRNRIWSLILLNFPQAPWGVSFFGGRSFFSEFASRPFYFHWVDHGHNLFFDLLLTTGIPGVLLLLAFLWTLFPLLRRATEVPLTAALVVYMLIHNMTEPRLFVPSIFMFIFSLFVFASQKQMAEQTQ